MNDIIIKEYEEFVLNCVNRFGSLSNLVRMDEIDPIELNLALGSYLKVSLGLAAEYQKYKLIDFNTEMDYDDWYADKFEECKQDVIAEYSGVNDGLAKSNAVKPSLKEFTLRVKYKYSKELRAWEEKKKVANSEMRFILRLLDMLKKYDNILSTLSNNMRQEMRSLSVVSRANANPETVANNRVRKGFPSEAEQKRNRENLQ